MKILVLLALFQDPDETLKTLREALATSGEDGQIDAIREALKLKHEKVIKAVATKLTDGTEKVRIGTALALGDTDHPASVDALVAAIQPNKKIPVVLAAIAQSLGKLGWEAAAAPLNELLKSAGDADVRKVLPDVMDALGQIGSASSVEPLIDFLARFLGRGRPPWPNSAELENGAKKNLKAITGGEPEKPTEWDDWWKAGKGALLKNAKRTYWVKKTGERVEAEKPPADSILVGARMVAKPAPKKKKDK